MGQVVRTTHDDDIIPVGVVSGISGRGGVCVVLLVGVEEQGRVI